MEKTIFHIDVNSAFLSWEAARRLQEGSNEDLRLIPSAVTGDVDNRRGIILAKSTPAKKYGIVTGEPTSHALRKCPELICVSPDFKLYTKQSARLFEFLESYSDRIEEYSIDECFLDYTGMEEVCGEAMETAFKIKDRIKNELGFTVNIGVSSNKLLAKMAGELEKPDKVITLFPEEISTKMWPLPVEELFMVGKRTSPKLKKLGIYTIGDLAHYDINILKREFKSFAYILNDYSNGRDNSLVSSHRGKGIAKSIGNSTTIPFDITDRETACNIILSLSETVARRLRKDNLSTCEIAVSIKTNEFKVYSHQKTLMNSTDCTNAIFQNAVNAFDEVWHHEPIRLLGVKAGQLCGGDCIQLSISEDNWDKQRKADEAMDKIRMRFGNNAVMRSTFLNVDKKMFDCGKSKSDL